MIWSHLLKKFLMENFIFCAVIIAWTSDLMLQDIWSVFGHFETCYPYILNCFVDSASQPRFVQILKVNTMIWFFKVSVA